MAFMVEAVQQVTTLRLILDSPDARVLARGGPGRLSPEFAAVPSRYKYL
jgi:hypothetical protein